MTLEVCSDSMAGVQLASNYNVKRVELCSAISLGGLTPSMGLVRTFSRVNGIKIHAMIRNREGDFRYNEVELEAMEKDISSMAKLGVSGVVFGCLNSENDIDISANRYLINLTKKYGIETTFHRAFDLVRKPKKAIELLIDLGFDRLLTSGQEPKAIDGVSLLKELVIKAQDQIEIMAGSGVNASNAVEIAQSGVDALHFSARLVKPDQSTLGFGNSSIIEEEKIRTITRLFL